MKKFLIKIVFFILAAYGISTFISQQKLLNSYAAEKEEYNNRIETAEAERKELNETLSNLNSANYIEGIARDKLDMYLPNERVYIDITK